MSSDICNLQLAVNNTIAKKDKELYQSDELELINLSKQVRGDIVKELVKDGVPTSSRDIRVLNEVLNSMDAQINSLAATRLKLKDVEDNTESRLVVREMLEAIRTKKENLNNNNREIYVPDSVIPTDIVTGELDVGKQELDISEFKSEE